MHAFRIPSTVVILFALVCLPAIGSATTWNVPNDAATIQAGIDSAAAGDTVLVECGTYYEHGITMKSGIVLTSETGLAECVQIDAESQQCFTCSGLDSTTVIEGLTIRNALVTGNGAGMYIDSSSLQILNCDFESCVASDYGGGIWFGESQITLTGCNFRDCEAVTGRGGAVNLYTAIATKVSVLDLAACGFDNNSAGDRGGAVNSQLGKLNASECKFSGNSSAGFGGAVSVSQSDSVVRFTDCVFDENSCGDIGGGAIFARACSLEVTGCTMYGNSAVLGGSAISLQNAPTPTSLVMHRTIIAFGQQGEPVYCTGGESVAVSCSDIYGNAAGDWVGCIAGMDGANGNFSQDPLFCSRETGDYYLRPCSPCLDAPGCGLVGALGEGDCPRVWLVPGDAATIQAGIDSACAGDTVLVASGTYNENLAMKSGIYVIAEAADPESTIVDANGVGAPVAFLHLAETTYLVGFTITGGLTNYGGGIVCIDAAPEVINCRIVDNHANQQGGGILCEQSAAPVFTGCVIAGNTSGDVGGVLASYSNSHTTFMNCTLCANGAAGYGGSIYVLMSTASLQNSIIAFGTAGAAVHCDYLGSVSVSCTDIYGNAGGDWVGCIAGQAGTNGNFSEDPRFCDATGRDFHVSPCSPCLNAPGCGLVGALGSGGCALTWNVPAQVPTIGAALDTACAGDTVIVACGTYYEHDIEMKPGVILMSETMQPDCVTIDADSLGRVMRCVLLDGATVIQGFTFTNGYADSGGAVSIESASPTIISCEFLNCGADDAGGGIYCSGSSPHLTDCDFVMNDAPYGGALLSIQSNSSITSCDFLYNTASSGGAIKLLTGADDTLTDCTFDTNAASGAGGAIGAEGGAPILVGCDFTTNTAATGGAIYFAGTLITMTGCMFSGNGSTGWGGGIYLDVTAAAIDTCFFYDNSGNTGGGVWGQSSAASVTGCEFHGNHASNAGGAFGFQLSTGCSFESCVFDSNSAATAYGGAIFALQSNGLTITDCDFTRNYGNTGGAALIWNTPATVSSCLFSQNSAATDGGGLYVDDSMPLHVDDCRISDNSAPRGGGIFLLEGPATITQCVITDNTGTSSGGAVYNLRGSLNMDECTLYGNDASAGGGIFAEGTSTNSLTNTIIGFSPQGEAIGCSGAGTNLSCCDLYGNAGGDWVGCIAGQDTSDGNLSVDPYFCDADGGDLRLGSDSRCLHTACGRIGALGRGCFGYNPWITSIEDIGNDQGRSVRLAWERTRFDAPSDTIDIDGYEVYRRQDEYLAGTATTLQPGLGGDGNEAALLAAGWDYLGVVPAHGESLYQFVAPTLCDSTAQDSICWSVFLVRATTPDPFFYLDSYPDSGYSVDNLAPAAPPGLTMASPTELAWEEVPDADFDYYSAYGSDEPELDGSAVLIGYTVDTAKDLTGHVYDYYHVTATDFSGNEGEEASVNNIYAGVPGLPDAPGGSDIPKAFALKESRPSPFSSSTVIAFDLPDATGARITIYDAHGRIIKRLTNNKYGAGRHAVTWQGDDEAGNRVGSGIYFIRMEAGTFQDMKKVMLLR